MSIAKGNCYRWHEILKELDAEDTPPPYALHRDGHVVGFALNRWQNPRAPGQVLVGPGPERERYAEIFITEQPTVPVLIKEAKGDNVWRCAGYFKLERPSDDAAERNGRLNPPDIPAIYKILFLSEVTRTLGAHLLDSTRHHLSAD